VGGVGFSNAGAMVEGIGYHGLRVVAPMARAGRPVGARGGGTKVRGARRCFADSGDVLLGIAGVCLGAAGGFKSGEGVGVGVVWGARGS